MHTRAALHTQRQQTDFTPYLLGVLFVLLLGCSAKATAAEITITSAFWDTSRTQLMVEVSGADFAPSGKTTLLIIDGISGREVSSKSVRIARDGSFSTRVRQPINESSLVPCSIGAQIGAVSSTTLPVANAPADCSGGAAPNQPPVANAGPDQFVTLTEGQLSATVTLNGTGSSDADGSIVTYTWSGSPDPTDIASPSLALVAGSYTFTLVVTDNEGASSAPDSVNVTVSPPVTSLGELQVLAANDLGMHCADLDYQVFSILPPYNVLHAQVVEKGTAGQLPRIVGDDEVSVYYRATSSPNDPAGGGSLNTTSDLTLGGAAKSNFWKIDPATGHTLAYLGYGTLYPYDAGLGASLLSLYDPLATNTGLPVPDTFELANGNLVLHQQQMPGLGNTPRPFARFDQDLPFFESFPAGTRLTDINWFAAEGVPMLPLDDEGRLNPYPLMAIQARDIAGNTVLASNKVVVPVASEADCQICHAAASDGYSGLAADFASVNIDADPNNDFTVMTQADAQAAGLAPEYLLNAAKMNILRLHDAKHRTTLEQRRPVQCSQCHYSTALDLAQVGPIDEPDAGPNGRQQTTHISMSRAMHAFHGAQTFSGEKVFPQMPPIRDSAGNLRPASVTQSVLEQTCYSCHPGKETKCLRGAMETGGMVCQDCHGNMEQVGNDFSGEVSASNPAPGGLDNSKRMPWLNEPRCDSCHTGDAVASNHPASGIVADDGIRLLQAYQTVSLSDGTSTAQPYTSSVSRFAQNEPLYRLSKGHGGVMCEGCHSSTHAIFPNAKENANDNLTSKGLQGHSGTVIECTTCHEAGSLGVTLDGPHGMHPVGDSGWMAGHDNLSDNRPDLCTTCHGSDGQGTALSKMAATRTLPTHEGGPITLAKGHEVGCVECHENKITH